MATIDLTVKTLDSRNHQFTVPEAVKIALLVSENHSSNNQLFFCSVADSQGIKRTYC